MKKYLIGIDLGGTDIKGGILNPDGEVRAMLTKATRADKGQDVVVGRIGDLVADLISAAKIKKEEAIGVGIGIPGMIDSKRGVVTYSNNLRWRDVHIAELLGERFGLPIAITNDANAAALGEVTYGAARGMQNCIMITLGTGVGGGIVVDGKLLEGNGGAGAEIGHMIIRAGGLPCSCGNKGCFESYSSATALINATKKKLRDYPESKMWSAIKSIEQVDGKLPWDFCGVDPVARDLIDEYTHYLAIGTVNMCNIFRPQAVIFSGGISRQGDNLIARLRPLVAAMLYGGALGPQVELLTATLRNDAGFHGAAALLLA